MPEFVENNFLSQLVSEPTHENNILDLVIASQDYFINNIAVDEHFTHVIISQYMATLTKRTN